MLRHDFVATRAESLLLIIDVQQAMLKAIDALETRLHRTRQLIQAADTLAVPILLTEQYRKGLGATCPELLQEIPSPTIFHKEHFSACLEPDFVKTISAYERRKLVVAGMETHVCVLQTCLDLIKAGFQVHLAADAVGSRKDENRTIALELLRQAGAVITSAEIVIFQWAARANTADFRKILPIVK